MYDIITQAIGYVSTAIVLASFQCKSSRKLIFMQLCGNAIHMIQFIMLGAYAGCASLFVSCIRNLVFSRKEPWAYWKGWPWVMVGLNILAAILTWQGPLSVLPLIGVASYTLASWSRNGKKIRLTSLCISSPVWIVYDVVTGSWSGVCSEAFGMCSVVLSVIRYGWKALDNSETAETETAKGEGTHEH